MSGFGTGAGFGSPAPGVSSQQNPFGSQPPQTHSQFSSGVLGSQVPAPSVGFGAAASSSAPFGGGPGNGIPTPTPGGAPSFGTSPGNAIQQAPASFAPTGTMTFGTSTSTVPSIGFGNFNSASSTAGFGAPTPAPFSSNAAASASGFGSQASPFGGNQMSNPHFGGPQPTQTTTITPPNPFQTSSSTAAAPVTTFGVSSSIAPATPAPAPTTYFPSPSSSSGFGVSATSGVGTLSSSSGFGTTAFGGNDAQRGDDDEMVDGEENDDTTPGPFGTTPAAPFASASTPSWPSRKEGDGSGSTPVFMSGAIPRKPTTDTSMFPAAVAESSVDAQAQNEEDAKLAALRAKIEAKKKRLEAQRRRKEASSAEEGDQTENRKMMEQAPGSSVLSTSAKPFVPSLARGSSAITASRKHSSAAQISQEGTDGSGQDEIAGSDEAIDQDDRSRLDTSLVGSCPYMCPDDELLRREQEGDIQLLETPQPGTIHPEGWTLRNTAVKRFRRSAADYKLNVPEWVRPPDVLETVCGYLEEWVMERDRQGPDPRFTQSPSPPPLEVYLFIWDRTRMIRKDFTLQNYVGTGGKCDARAVRCHERIARWHAMCEHQLSHIPDFVSMQSQQNIQELGQTMKTLNQYYDDALGRSTVEIPDDDGSETVADFKGRNHGCGSDFVMGSNPVDFDGTPLNNDPSPSSLSSRLVGARADTPCHGTAEPEMRGLYILLTMNNDGGMEVLKYAAYLFRERPEVYHSAPVQLALRIFKAKKEYNYARFFSYLRSPSTPYLFACIMFKHVEQMRKIGFRIMSKAYGARRKDSGEAVYDAYPLKRLVQLMCFEDAAEAIAACKHFNITVKQVQVASSSSPSGTTVFDVILWRHSDFKEAKDPQKGTVLSLQPWKMLRTIESKLKGVTRLAVCRGDVSGDGAALVAPVVPRQMMMSMTPEEQDARRRLVQEARAVAQQEQEARARQLEEEAARRKMEEKRRLREEAVKQNEMKRQREENERKRQEAERLRELELQKKREAEVAEKRVEEEKREKAAFEAAKRAAAAAAAAEERRKLEEEQRRIAEIEAAKKKAEETARERERQEMIRRQREEQERRVKLRLEEEARAKREAELERLRILKLKRQQEDDEKRRKKEAKERQIALEWEKKANYARKLVLWRRLRYRLSTRFQLETSKSSLLTIDPTLMRPSPFVPELYRDPTCISSENDGLVHSSESPLVGLARIRLLGRDRKLPLNLSSLLLNVLDSKEKPKMRAQGIETILLKLAVDLPEFRGPHADGMYELVHRWIGQRLQYGEVVEEAFNEMPAIIVRTVAVAGRRRSMYDDCDAMLCVIPPYFGDEIERGSVTFHHTDRVIPRVILDLDDGTNAAYSNVISDIISRTKDNVAVVRFDERESECDHDDCLWESCSKLLKAFSENIIGIRRVTRTTISHLGVRCIQAVLWRQGFTLGINEEEQVIARVRAVLVALVNVLQDAATEYENSASWHWPAPEFLDESCSSVRDYFGPNENLPIDWKKTLYRSEIKPVIQELYGAALDQNSFSKMMTELLHNAPLEIKGMFSDMFTKRQLRRCLEYALLWRDKDFSNVGDTFVVYFGNQDILEIVDRCVNKVLPNLEFLEANTGITSSSAVGAQGAVLFPTPVIRGADRNETAVDSEAASPIGNQKTPSKEWKPSTVTTQESAMSPIGVQTPLSLPAQSLNPKRAATETGGQGTKGVKRFVTQTQTNAPKRRRESDLSETQKESYAFTEKLEAMLYGETTIDFNVGNSRLSELLKDAPKIQLPMD